MNTRHTLAAALTLAASLTAVADIKVNDSLSVSGYAAGSYRFTDPDPGPSTDKMDLDAVKTMFTTNFKPVTGVVSLFYQPNAPHDVTVLDAYATVDVGGGSTITAGKFLSYLGYEAFDIPNMAQISYANGDFLGPIPGYHSGVKWDYSDKETGFGLALLDSVYSGPNYLKGDGELKHNAGFEGYFVYKAIPDVTVWAGFAYDTKGNVIHKKDEIVTFNIWASYNLTKDSTLALEFVTKDGGLGDKGTNWLVFYSQNYNKNWSAAFRVSGEKLKAGPGFTKFTVSPSYKVNDNFLVRAEVSYYDYTKAGADTGMFFGVQTVFKF
ncbi:outer membrane beta-barrel protein [Horticoccus sp. 23ND18S-11]|uniref:outer membrane beta-barrel protein n=1 Tax=Horticoccus sp. 23ND18S-11 TaxID=3391832 RepID=UPI0039C8E763